jgi:hypothetical protein
VAALHPYIARDIGLFSTESAKKPRKELPKSPSRRGVKMQCHNFAKK